MGGALETARRWEGRLCLILLASIPTLYGILGSVSRLQIPLLLIFTLWLILLRSYVEGDFKLYILRHEIPLILMISWTALSSIWTVNLGKTVGYLGNLLVGIGIYLALRGRRVREREGVYLLVGIATFVAIYGIYQRLWVFGRIMDLLKGGAFPLFPERGEMISRVGSGRVFSTFATPGVLGGYMASAIALGLGLMADLLASGRKGLVPIPMVSLMLMFSCLGLTLSLGGWISLLLSVSLFAFFIGKNRKSLFLLLICALLLFLLTLIIRSKEVTDPIRSPWGQRAMNWWTALKIFGDHPLLGTGAGTFGNVYVRYKDPLANEVQDAHNTLLQIASELGAPGAILFSAFLILFLLHIVRWALYVSESDDNRFIRIGLLCSVVALLFHGFLDIDWFVPESQWLLWAILGLTVGSSIPNRSYFLSFKLRRNLWIFSMASMLLLISLIPTIRFGMAAVHFEAGEEAIWEENVEEAHKEFSKAVSLNPLDGRYHAAKAYSLLLMIRMGKAPRDDIWKVIEGYEMAAKASPTSAGFRATLAKLYMSLRDFKKAVENAEGAVRNYPSKPEYRELLRRAKEEAR